MHLEASFLVVALAVGVTSSFRASESDVRHFSWVVWRCVFVWFWGGFWWWFAVAEAGAWDASGGISPGRCLGGVTSSFRASESDVRHFSWVVWRCVFVWFWGGFWWWFAVAEAAAWDASGGISPGRCLGGVTSSFRASESDVRHFSWVVWRCVFVWFWGGFWWWFAVAEAAAWDASGGISPGRCLGGVITSSFRASESDVRHFSWVVWRCVFVWFWGGFWWWYPPQNQTKTQRHTTHEKCLTSLSEALKEEVTLPRQRPGEMPPDASQAAASATANHHQNPPQNQTKTQRHTTHEKCLTSLSEALKEEVTPPRQRPGEMPPDASPSQLAPKRRSYTAKATTRRDAARCITITISVTSETSLARSPWNDGVGGFRTVFVSWIQAYTCGLKLGMCAPGGALFRPKNESTTRNACTPQVLLFFWKYEFFWYRWHAFFANPLTVWDTWNACTWNARHFAGNMRVTFFDACMTYVPATFQSAGMRSVVSHLWCL